MNVTPRSRPMRPTLDRSIVIGIGLMVGLLSIMAAVSYRNISVVSQNAELVGHTHEVEQLASDLTRSTAEALTRQREFLLRGDDQSLADYQAAVQPIPARLQELSARVSDNSSQVERLEKVQAAAQALIETLERGVALRRSGLDFAGTRLAQDSSEQQWSAIVDLMGDVRTAESRLLTTREAELRRSYRIGLISAIASLVLGVSLFAAVVEMIRRNLAARERQQAELYAGQEHLAITLASIGDAVVAADTEGRITHINGVASELTRWPVEEATGRPLHDVFRLIHETTRQTVENPVDRVLATGQIVALANHTVLIARDGSERSIADSAAPIRNAAGEIIGVVLILRDITDQRLQELREEARHQLIALRAEIGMLVARKSGVRETLQQCTDAMAARLNAPLVRIWSVDPTAATLDASASSAAPGAPRPAESPLALNAPVVRLARETDSGVIVDRPPEDFDLDPDWIRAQKAVCVEAFPLRLEDRLIGLLAIFGREPLAEELRGEFQSIAALITQFMERREIDEARQQSEQRFRTLANSIPQLAWMARPNGEVFWFNQRWFDYTGALPEQMEGWGWVSAIGPQERPQVLASFRRSISEGSPWEETFTLRRSDGVYDWHLSRAVPVRDDQGRILLWFGTNTDVSQQRETLAALRRSEAFAGGVVNSSTDCLKVLDLDGRLQWMNESGKQLMDVCDMSSITGREWPGFWEEGPVRDAVRQAMQSAVDGTPARFQGPCPTLQGVLRWWDVTVSPICGPDDRPEQLLIVSRDITERRIAEERLRKSEQNLRLVIDSMFAFVGILAPDGTLLEANRAPVEAAGLNRDEVIGQKFWDTSWWTHSSAVRERLQQAFRRAAAGEIVRYDEVVQLHPGELITIDFMLQPVFEQEQLLFVIPSGVDVTDRKRAEQQLAASQDFLRSSLDALTTQITVLDETGRILAVNQAWRSYSALSRNTTPAQAVGRNFLEDFLPHLHADADEAEDAQRGIQDVIAGREPVFVLEYPSRSPQGEQWYQMRVTRFSEEGPAYVVVAHEDITARIDSEAAMLRWSEQQHALAELAVRLAAAQDVNSTLELVTNGARQIVVADEAETIWMTGDDWSTAIRFTSAPTATDRSHLAAPTPKGDSIRNDVRRTNRPLRLAAAEWELHERYRSVLQGKPAPAGGCLAAPLGNREGLNIGLIQICGRASGDFNDDDEAILVQLAQMASVALERARLYEEIREVNQRKDEFLATLAHELRNPLSAMTSGTQLLTLHPDNISQVAETAELILRQCVQLKQLVDDLLDVSRISRGKLSLQIRPLRLLDAIESAVDIARPFFTASHHAFTQNIVDAPLVVRGDAVRLSQVVANLLINACKYTPEGGRIELNLSIDGGDALLVVRDNGIGIPAQMLDRIFELFAQVDSSNTRAQGGLGIGLTLASTLVQMHGGSIRVLSDGPHCGSTFTVRLPLATLNPEEQAAMDESQLPPSDYSSRRILLVDDNRAAVHLLSRLLSSLGQAAKTAENGQTALEIMEDFHPDVVISDIAMPDMSGYDLAARIRQLPEIRQPFLVALTGYGQASDRAAALNAGFDFHLTKPVSLEQLTTLLSQISANRR